MKHSPVVEGHHLPRLKTMTELDGYINEYKLASLHNNIIRMFCVVAN